MHLTSRALPLDVGARPSPAASPESGPAPDPAAGPSRAADVAHAAEPVAIDADDVRSFDAFYASARTTIGRAVALAVGDVDLASDATDEAMARAYERWALVSRLERPEGWVYRVAVNWSVSVLRHRRRSLHRLYEPAAADGPQLPDPALHDALGSLDVKHRSVVVCRHLLGWSVAETADALGVREGTVKSRLHRALRTLEARLGHQRDTEDQP
jgi:RNA polymerase sigma factor (sigma-70 family)